MSELNRHQQVQNTLTRRFRAEERACRLVSTPVLEVVSVDELLSRIDPQRWIQRKYAWMKPVNAK